MKGEEMDRGEIGNKCTKGIKERKNCVLIHLKSISINQTLETNSEIHLKHEVS
jgi:hypothetical protein